MSKIHKDLINEIKQIKSDIDSNSNKQLLNNKKKHDQYTSPIMINLPYVSFKQFFNHFFFRLTKYFYTPCKFEKLPNIYIIDDIPSEIFDL